MLLDELIIKYPDMHPSNYFIDYDDLINTIKATLEPRDPLLSLIVIKVMEQKFPQYRWLSWEDILECVKNWPFVLCPKTPFSEEQIRNIAIALFFGFDEWKTSWTTRI